MADKTDKKHPKPQPNVVHPGMMGDGTEEQNLSEPGDPAARIKKADVEKAFGQPKSKPD